ncbi:RND transporter [Betaproteobacteria bacterium SCGC AG-212-J23]|nr:RND transporter [Betaproteobacteria bacterium SCGC AG-212-J23]
MKKLLVFTSLFVAGCAVGPDYQRPDSVVSSSFKELEGWRSATPQDEAPRGSWWSVFGDAELDRLLARLDISNQNVRAAEARVRQAKSVADQARAGYFPTVSANASAVRSKSPSLSNAPSFATGAVNTFNANVAASSWELDLWGKVRRTVEAGDASWQASTADLEAAKLSARAALAQSYFSLRVADVNRRLLEDTVAGYQRNLELTQNRYKAGVAARVDVVQAEQQLKGAQAQLLDVGVSRAQFEHSIAILIGEAPANFSLAATTDMPAMPRIPVSLPSLLLERRPDVAAAERSTAAANARIGVAKAAMFPSLSLSGTYGTRAADIADLFTVPSRLWSIGAAATQPLFDAGLRRAQTDQAIGQYDEAVATYRQTVLTAFQQVEDNLAALRILEEEAAVQAETVEAARKSVELTNNQYQAGVVSFLNVIITQAALLNAEQNAANVLGRRLNASVGLVQALGGGWSTESLASR